MKLVEATVTPVVYEKSTSETSDRVIIPTYVPTDAVKAIDVTELEPAERQEIAALYKEYAEYKESFVNRMFNFEDWLEHTQGVSYDLKWRTFKVAGLK